MKDSRTTKYEILHFVLFQMGVEKIFTRVDFFIEEMRTRGGNYAVYGDNKALGNPEVAAAYECIRFEFHLPKVCCCKQLRFTFSNGRYPEKERRVFFVSDSRMLRGMNGSILIQRSLAKELGLKPDHEEDL